MIGQSIINNNNQKIPWQTFTWSCTAHSFSSPGPPGAWGMAVDPKIWPSWQQKIALAEGIGPLSSSPSAAYGGHGANQQPFLQFWCFPDEKWIVFTTLAQWETSRHRRLVSWIVGDDGQPIVGYGNMTVEWGWFGWSIVIMGLLRLLHWELVDCWASTGNYLQSAFQHSWGSCILLILFQEKLSDMKANIDKAWILP